MKFFVAFVALVAVAVALPSKPLNHVEAELQAIVDAIHSPSTDPATAILLQQQLAAILAGENHEDIVVDEVEPSPVTIVDAPVPEPQAPAPAASSPLVQIIVNVNSEAANAVDVVQPSPVVVGPGFETFPVEDIDTAPVIVGPIPEPSPVDFVDNVEVDPTPVIVVEEAEVAEPVIVAPIAPAPVVNIPEILN